MSELGDVLELMHSSFGRWGSLRVEGFEWRHLRTFARAWDQHVSELRKSRSVSVMSAVRLERLDGRQQPEESREGWRIWLAKPNKRRVQFQVGDEIVTAVFAGDRWWSWSPSRGFLTNDGATSHSHGIGPAEGLIDPARHIPSFDFRLHGQEPFVGRAAFLVTAVPRSDEHDSFGRSFHLMGTGADEYRLIVDAEVGLILRCEAKYQGDSFRVLEVEQVGVDEAFSETVFDPDSLRLGPDGLT